MKYNYFVRWACGGRYTETLEAAHAYAAAMSLGAGKESVIYDRYDRIVATYRDGQRVEGVQS